MGRIRSVKPEFFLHEGLFDLEAETGLPVRLSFAGLWCQADREGRFKWEPRRLKATILPYDDVDFSRVLDALTTRDFIRKYAVNQVIYGHIPGFFQHQIINNREKASSLPEPNQNNYLTRQARVDDASTTRAIGKGREGKGREQESDARTHEPSSLSDWPYQDVTEPDPPRQTLAGAFPMTLDWQPGPDIEHTASLQGLDHTSIGAECLAEFRAYWRATGKAFPQAMWEHKLIRSAKQRPLTLVPKANGTTGGLTQDQIDSVYREVYGDD